MAGTSSLLRLPAELRNRIYELALTDTKSLYHHKSKGAGDRPYLYLRDGSGQQENDEKPAEYNQLKYVNKQLYAETADLELKFNEITLFMELNHVPSSEVLIEWLSSVPTEKKSWINTINIKYKQTFDIIYWLVGKGTVPGSSLAIARLTSLCNEIPSMTVRYYIPSWYVCFHATLPSNGFFFFVHARYVQHLLRGTGFENVSTAHYDFDTAMEGGEEWRHNKDHESVDLADLQAKNLTYFPTIPEGARIPIVKDQFMAAGDDEIIPEAEQWIGNKYIRDWIQHGI